MRDKEPTPLCLSVEPKFYENSGVILHFHHPFPRLHIVCRCNDLIMMDRLRESALFMKTKASKQEYAQIEGNDSEEALLYQATSASRPRWRLIPLISSFLLGALTVVLALGLWQIITANNHGTRTNRPFPEMREGADEKTGLPLSWSHGDCGNSPADAQALGCRYSIVLHSWLP